MKYSRRIKESALRKILPPENRSVPDGESALMLTAFRLQHVASTKWSTKKYLNMDILFGMEREKGIA